MAKRNLCAEYPNCCDKHMSNPVLVGMGLKESKDRVDPNNYGQVTPDVDGSTNPVSVRTKTRIKPLPIGPSLSCGQCEACMEHYPELCEHKTFIY